MNKFWNWLFFNYKMGVSILLLLREHKQGLVFKTCSFKSQDILDLSIFSLVFQHPIALGVDIEKLIWISGFCSFFPGGLTNYLDTVLCLLLGCSLSTHYECQDFPVATGKGT
jgi:hypothetical protein